jgi:dipeptidyl aminopeptidase/acylaminoacyl peptidase
MRQHFCALLVGFSGLCQINSAAAARVENDGFLFDEVQQAPAALAARVDAYLSGRDAHVRGWTNDGQLLIATRFGETQQLHLVAAPGGERRQLTFARDPCIGGAFSPDPAAADFVYLQDHDGDGNYQLFYRHAAEASAQRLTDGKSVNVAPVWSNAGQTLAFATTARDGKSLDVDLVAPQSGALPHLVVSGEGGAWYPLDWSPDDGQLLVLDAVSRHEGHVFLVDLDSGKKREIDTGPAAVSAARFSRDGQGAYLISNLDSEFSQLRFVNFFTGQKSIVSGRDPGDVEAMALSRDGHYLAFVSDQGGVDRLELLDLRAHQDLTVPPMPTPGLIRDLVFDGEGKRLAFSYEAVAHPGDAYVFDIAARRIEQWTHSEAGAVDTGRFVLARLVRFPGFERENPRGRDVPAYVYAPAGAGPHPVLILLGGGKERQFRPGFDPWIQYLAGELGFAVVAPNLRGSLGYGKTYAGSSDGRAREDAVKDIGALLVWLRAQSEFDAEHIAVAGEGYGGYLALAALVNYGDRLRGAIDVGGIADFVAWLELAPSPRQEQLRKEFGDERDADTRDYLRRISPLSGADRIAKPVLIVQGGNDPEVSASQSEELLNRLRSRGADVRYLLIKTAGQDLGTRQEREVARAAEAQFLNSLR